MEPLTNVYPPGFSLPRQAGQWTHLHVFVSQVPPGLRGQAHLKVWGNRYLKEDGYIFHNYTTVTVESKGTAVFIQTDKPFYKPKHKGLNIPIAHLPQ